MNDLLFTDCHTHILPGIDDGAPSTDISLQMLAHLHAQGVGDVWLSPHFYPYEEDISLFLERRAHAFDILHASAPSAPRLHLASEVFLSDYLFQQSDLTPLCLDGGRTLLLELPFESVPSDKFYQKIDRLLSYFDVIPVLVHIDRYPKLFHDKKAMETLTGMGCAIQVNLQALSEGLLTKRKLLKYLQNNQIHLIGTDCHNMTARKPEFSSGLQSIKKALGQEVLNRLAKNAHDAQQNTGMFS